MMDSLEKQDIKMKILKIEENLEDIKSIFIKISLNVKHHKNLINILEKELKDTKMVMTKHEMIIRIIMFSCSVVFSVIAGYVIKKLFEGH